jgi:hypothetical protein
MAVGHGRLERMNALTVADFPDWDAGRAAECHDLTLSWRPWV